MIRLERKASIPLYEQIYTALKEDIENAKLKYNERLLPTRALALKLGVSRQTVATSYEQLMSEGYIYSKVGSGYFVKKHTKKNLEKIENVEKIEDFEVVREKEENYLYDFSPIGIDSTVLPTSILKKISRELLSQKEFKTENNDNKGSLKLRKEVLKYLEKTRGIKAKVNNIVLGIGTQYLLFIINMLLKKDRIIIENPCYLKNALLLEKLGMKVEAIDLDKEGIKTKELKKSKASLMLISPNHQYPTGIVTSINRRYEILSWLREEKDRYLIEDDYDSDFRYKGSPIKAMKAMSEVDNIIYLGSFSRILSNSFRFAFAILPDSLSKKYEEEFSFLNLSLSSFNQEILYRFISQKYFERYINRLSLSYKVKHDLIVKYLKKLKDIEVLGDSSGAHLLLQFKNYTESEIVNLMKAAKIKVYPLSEFYFSKTKKETNTVLVGFSSISIKELEEAMKIFIKIVDKLKNK